MRNTLYHCKCSQTLTCGVKTHFLFYMKHQTVDFKDNQFLQSVSLPYKGASLDGCTSLHFQTLCSYHQLLHSLYHNHHATKKVKFRTLHFGTIPSCFLYRDHLFYNSDLNICSMCHFMPQHQRQQCKQPKRDTSGCFKTLQTFFHKPENLEVLLDI
jgi:hypothetical protein